MGVVTGIMGLLTVIAALAVIILLWGIVLYNRFIKNQNQVQEAWSGIDVQLKRRHNLVPNLVETVKGYAAHEKTALEQVTAMRTGAENAKTVGDKAKTEGMLGHAIANVFAVAEAYPDLKASENFQGLQRSLGEMENHIQLSRRYYNGSVRDLNVLVDSFPSNIIANMFGFHKEDFFELQDAADRDLPDVSF